MVNLTTFADFARENHRIGLYCGRCRRWSEVDFAGLEAAGMAERPLRDTRFRCRDCGEIGEIQIRPPVPTIDSDGR